MRLFLLSDTAILDRNLRESLSSEIDGRGNSVAYVSSSTLPESREYFEATSRDYLGIGTDIRISYFDLGMTYDDGLRGRLLNHGTIHLSGGNALAFAKMLDEIDFGSILAQHLTAGGLVLGVSAGAIVLTPRIGLALLGGDRHVVGAPTAGLDLVPFEFYPHYRGAEEEDLVLASYSRGTESLVVACSDVGGILYDDGRTIEFGNVAKFHGGARCG